MSSDKKNIIYTAWDIEQYLAGKLPASKMHEMEKAALDDPFLTEAMQGFEGMQNKDWKSQLAVARKQITENGLMAKVVPLQSSAGKWWKIAAAVVIIGGGSVLTFVLTTDKDEDKTRQQIAQTISDVPEPDTTNDNTVLAPAFENKQKPGSVAEENKKQASGLLSENNPTTKPDSIFINRAGKTASDDLAKKGTGEITVSVNPRSLPETAKNLPSAASVNNSQDKEEVISYKVNESAKQSNNNEGLLSRQAVSNRKDQQLVNNFNAQVVGTDNSPLPFTNISIKEENFGTYADVNGNFRLISMDTLLTIEVKSVGYLPKTFPLRSNQPLNKIVLQEDQRSLHDRAQIQDKDFTESRKPRPASVLVDSLVTAEPADGWENYNTYVSNNIPDVLLKNDFHGEVGISFDVKANGTITNIRVSKSMGNVYDEAAKKLIQQGPQWKIKKGKKTSASITLQF